MYDVIIVGCGPVGACLGNILGMYGVNTLILEKDPGLFSIPRAVHADHNTMRIFQSIGLHEEILVTTQPSDRARCMGVNDQFATEVIMHNREFGFHPGNMFHQPTLEGILRGGLTRFPSVTLKTGVEVITVRHQEGMSELTVEGDDASKTYTSRFVVACDGARSTVRKQVFAQHRLESLGIDMDWLIVDGLLQDDKQRSQLPVHPTHYCRVWPRRMYSLIPCVYPRYRWEILLLDSDDRKTITLPENVEPLISEFVDKPSALKLDRASVYSIRTLCAPRWKDDNTFLAGDAAHQTPPFMGHGMCAGMEDVHNLAWKLAFVLQGSSPATLLNTYEHERKSHAQIYIQRAAVVGTLLAVKYKFLAKLRDVVSSSLYQIRSAREGWDSALTQVPSLGTENACFATNTLGCAMPVVQPMVRLLKTDVAMQISDNTPGARLCRGIGFEDIAQDAIRMDDLYGAGFAVVGVNIEPKLAVDYAEHKSTFDSVHTNFIHFTDQAPSCSGEVTTVVAADKVMEEWLSKLTGGNVSQVLVVVRPDRYVFGVYRAEEAKKIGLDIQTALGKPYHDTEAPSNAQNMLAPLGVLGHSGAVLFAVLCAVSHLWPNLLGLGGGGKIASLLITTFWIMLFISMSLLWIERKFLF